MSQAPSFRQLIADKTVKRADAMKVRVEDLHEEPGFNLRREGEDLEASIAALAAHIAEGGMVPPLEVRPRAEGGVYVVDGHRRRRAYLSIADTLRDGDGELWLPVVAFTGNDADRVARIITSAEGRALSPMEIADGYRRLIAFQWTADQIAKKVGKTRQHVDQLLILANANSDVQALVSTGKVSATTAIDAARKHGEGAGAILKTAVDKAVASGKGKATSGAINGKALPRKIVDELVGSTQSFLSTLSADAHRTMKTMSIGSDEASPMVEVNAAALWELLAVAEAVGEANAKQAQRGRAQAAQAAQADIEDASA